MQFQSSVLHVTMLIGVLSALMQTDAAGYAWSSQEPESKPFELRYVPDTTMLHLSVRPSEVLKHRSFEPMAEELIGWLSIAGVRIDELESWSFLAVATQTKYSDGRVRTRPAGLQIFVSRERNEFTKLKRLMVTNGSEETHKGVRFVAGRSDCYLQANDRTLILAESKRAMMKAIEAGEIGDAPASWQDYWRNVRTKPAACMIDLANFRKAIENEPPPPGIFSEISPMWQNADVAAIGLDLDQNITLRAVTASPSPDDAKKAQAGMDNGLAFVREELDTAIADLDAQIQQLREQSRSVRYVSEFEVIATLMPLLRQPLEQLKITQANGTLSASVSLSPVTIGRTSGKLAGLFRTLWGEHLLRERYDNLRQIALAMHNYHDVHQVFPPAWQMGKDGKGQHKVSWRVLILPFLGHNDIYQQYRFDEPWDSPTNQTVTARIPADYRAVESTEDSTYSDYCVIVGTNGLKTAFRGEKGRNIDEFRDGVSESMLVVETKRRVHWAKPDDIQLAKDGNLPKLGGITPKGFRLVRADGWPAFIADTQDEVSFWNLLTINDRGVVNRSLFTEESPPEDLTRKR